MPEDTNNPDALDVARQTFAAVKDNGQALFGLNKRVEKIEQDHDGFRNVVAKLDEFTRTLAAVAGKVDDVQQKMSGEGGVMIQLDRLNREIIPRGRSKVATLRRQVREMLPIATHVPALVSQIAELHTKGEARQRRVATLQNTFVGAIITSVAALLVGLLAHAVNLSIPK